MSNSGVGAGASVTIYLLEHMKAYESIPDFPTVRRAHGVTVFTHTRYVGHTRRCTSG
jgi:hypothetical protein